MPPVRVPPGTWLSPREVRLCRCVAWMLDAAAQDADEADNVIERLADALTERVELAELRAKVDAAADRRAALQAARGRGELASDDPVLMVASGSLKSGVEGTSAHDGPELDLASPASAVSPGPDGKGVPPTTPGQVVPQAAAGARGRLGGRAAPDRQGGPAG